MKKILKNKVTSRVMWIVIAVFIIAILVYTIIQYKAMKLQDKDQSNAGTRQIKKPMRVPLFLDPAAVRYGTRFNFTFDPPQVLTQFRKTEQLDRVVDGCNSDFQIAIKIMGWARDQWQPGRPDPYPPINAGIILEKIRRGETGGFCAQYNYVFVQGLHSLNIKARYVTIKDHEVTEVWLAKKEKWICFDPLNNCIYTDQDKNPLSVYEIRKNVINGAQVNLSGNFNIKDMKSHLAKFKVFAVWLKNDHISSPINFIDIDFYKVYYFDDYQQGNWTPFPSLFTTSLKDIYFDPENL